MQSVQSVDSSKGDIGYSEYLAFKAGNEEYGIDILKVQEIRRYDTVTSIANAPAFIKGVVNLRGVIVPIIDLRIKLQLGAPRYDAFTAVIVMNLGERVTGVVVDSVSDVVSLSREQIRPAPELGAGVKRDCLTGLGTLDDRMLILMDVDKLLHSIHAGADEACAV